FEVEEDFPGPTHASGEDAEDHNLLAEGDAADLPGALALLREGRRAAEARGQALLEAGDLLRLDLPAVVIAEREVKVVFTRHAYLLLALRRSCFSATCRIQGTSPSTTVSPRT